MDFVMEKAYAKINLYLDVVDKREDGYHNILSIMQNISLYDEIYVKFNSEKAINLTCENAILDVEPSKNLAYRAAERFYDLLNDKNVPMVDIKIIKNIPVAAGMAGGSSDAAATLRALNKLFGEPFTLDELCKIGQALGADVPFCIVGGTQICQGIGEKLTACNGLKDVYVVSACGNGGVLTPQAYKTLDDLFNNFVGYNYGVGFNDLLEKLNVKDFRESTQYMFNIFEETAKENESVQLIKEIMMSNKAIFAMMSGSGPSVFGIFENYDDAEKTKNILIAKDIRAHNCLPIDKME